MTITHVDALVPAPDLNLATDRWLTPDDELERIDMMWPQGIGFEPFKDPEAHVAAERYIDARAGGNAFVDDWDAPESNPTAFANSPYSGDNPARNAKRIVFMRRKHPRLCVLNLCIAAPGSAYWQRWVWPRVKAIAWMGRLPFRTAVDIIVTDKDTGKQIRKARAGDVVMGNRNEIAECLYGPSDSDDADVDVFRHTWRRYPITVVRR